MPAPSHNPELEYALNVGLMPTPADEREAFHAHDRPFQFGNDVIDNMHGIVNIAKNANTILRAPALPRCDHVPAIAIGSGPSVAQHLDAIRSLQHKCLIVAAQTAAQGLLEAGITPHLIAPMERPRSVADYLPHECSRIAFAGAPVVHPDVMNRFSRHYFVPSGDGVYRWCSLPGEDKVFFGSSTGVTAINVAAFCTKQRVYLVGHDLAYDGDVSHWSKSQSVATIRAKSPHTILGNNGEQLPTEYIWKRLCLQIARTCEELHSGLVNVNAHTGTGAAIPGTLSAPLPDPSTLPDFTMPESQPRPERLREWCRHARKMPMHARQLDRFFQNAVSCTPEQTDILRAGVGGNAYAFAYLLASVLAQMSYEHRMKTMTPDMVLQWFKSATHNVLYHCRDFFEQIQQCAEECRP